jgi:hypothetical protein
MGALECAAGRGRQAREEDYYFSSAAMSKMSYTDVFGGNIGSVQAVTGWCVQKLCFSGFCANQRRPLLVRPLIFDRRHMQPCLRDPAR